MEVRSPVLASFQDSVVAKGKERIFPPFSNDLISGSLPMFPTSITLFTVPDIKICFKISRAKLWVGFVDLQASYKAL
jgi:hypothetical protein